MVGWITAGLQPADSMVAQRDDPYPAEPDREV